MKEESNDLKLERMSFRLSCLQLASGYKSESEDVIETATKFMEFIEADNGEDTDSV